MPRPEERDFAGFRIVRPLELGAGASVWEAEDPESGERVAVETLAGEASRDEFVTEWFTEVWDLVGELDVSGIVGVVETGEQDGVPFAVRVPAGETTLAERLERGGPLSSGAALQVLGEIGEALERAHDAGVVHGALEPSCVVFDEHARAHLAGFGRAEGDRREDVVALGSLLLAMLGDPPEEPEGSDPAESAEPAEAEAEEPDAGSAESAEAEADEGSDPEEGLDEPSPPTRWELDSAEVLRDVGRAGAAGEFARAADLIAAARAARPPKRNGSPGSGGGLRNLWLALAAVAVAILIVVLFLSGGDDDGPSSTAAATTAGASTTPSTPSSGPARPIPVRGYPVGVATSEGVVYAVTRDGASLDGFDEETGERVLGPVSLGIEAEDLTVSDGVAWITGVNGKPSGMLARVDLSAETPLATVTEIGGEPGPIVAAADAIWVVDEGQRRLLRFPTSELTRGTEPEVTDLEAQKPNGIASGAAALWVSDGDGGVVRVDPADPGEQKAFDVEGSPSNVLVAAGMVWVTDSTNGSVVGIDPDDGETQELAVGGEPVDLAADAEHLWAANADRYVTTIDLSAGTIELIDLSGAGGTPQAIAAGGQVWVTTGSGNTLVAIAPAAD